MPELEVPAADALATVTAGDAFLLDVREQHEWDRGHSPLATLVPMSALGSRIAEVPDDRPILVVCHTGRRSLTVAHALADVGYDSSSVAGGMIAWNASGGEIVSSGSSEPMVD